MDGTVSLREEVGRTVEWPPALLRSASMGPPGFRDARLLDAAGVAKDQPIAHRTPGLGATFDTHHLIEARLLEILRRPQ